MLDWRCLTLALALVAPLALAGCGGAAQTAAEACAAAGARPGSRAYDRCVTDTEAKKAADLRKMLNAIPQRGLGPI